MGRWRRVAVGSALALAAVIAGGAVVLHALVDPERVKALAREKARTALSRDLTLGDVSVRLLPLPTIDASDVALSARDGKSAFLRAKEVDARLDLFALLAGKTRLRTLHLENVDLTPEGANTPWHVDEASFSADGDWREASVDAKVVRNGQALRVKAKLADLSRAGTPGAATEGEVQLAFAQTQVAIKGLLPIGHSLAPTRVHVDVKSPSLGDVFAFYALERRQSAPLEAHVDLQGAKDRLEAKNLQLTLGDARARGAFNVGTSGTPRAFDGKLAIERLDWARAMADAGTPTPPKRDTGLAFNPDALAWPLLERLEAWDGTLDTDVGSLKLRNGVELRNARFHFAFSGSRLEVDPVQAELLGGKGSARLRFDGEHKSVKVAFEGTGLLLERWFHERGRTIPFTGGPMNVHADFTATGNTMRDLAASATGPVALRMGPGAWNSKHAGDTEALMTNAFASEGVEKVQFECVSANLPFKAGIARGRSMVGFKTAASELIASGTLNLRDESIDLHGRVRAHKGVTLGLAQIAGDVKIGGHLAKPEMSIDPEATPGIIARAGAAIATLGVSVLGTALIEKMEPDRADPCEKPVRKKGGAEAGR